MDVSLSWDLLIILFVAVVCAYSFIVGRTEAVKIIIATYLSVVVVQGISTFLTTYATESNAFAASLGFTLDAETLSLVKLGCFVAGIIFLAIRGGFETEERDHGMTLNTLFTAAFGFATAGLLLSTLLTYIAGRPLLDDALQSAPSLMPLLDQSQLVQVLVEYESLWFAFPAALFIVEAIVAGRSEE